MVLEIKHPRKCVLTGHSLSWWTTTNQKTLSDRSSLIFHRLVLNPNEHMATSILAVVSRRLNHLTWTTGSIITSTSGKLTVGECVWSGILMIQLLSLLCFVNAKFVKTCNNITILLPNLIPVMLFEQLILTELYTYSTLSELWEVS